MQTKFSPFLKNIAILGAMKTISLWMGVLFVLTACSGEERYMNFIDVTRNLDASRMGSFQAASGEQLTLQNSADGSISITQQISLSQLDTNAAASTSTCEYRRQGKVVRMLYLPPTNSVRVHYGDEEKTFLARWPNGRLILQTDLKAFVLDSSQTNCPAQIEQGTSGEQGQFVLESYSKDMLKALASHTDASSQKLVPNESSTKTDFKRVQ